MSRLRLRLTNGRTQHIRLGRASRLRLGSQPGAKRVVVPDPSLAPEHALFERTKDGWFVRDLGTPTGTWVEGQPAEDWIFLRPYQQLRLGRVEGVFEPGLLARWLHLWESARATGSWKSVAVSLALHLALVLLASQAVLFVAQVAQPDFAADAATEGFLVNTEAGGQPAGGDAAAGPPTPDPLSFPVPASDVQDSVATLAAMTTTAASSFTLTAFSGPAVLSRDSVLRPAALRPGGGGGTSYRSAGFGKGSGFGRGVGDWVGSGQSGLGISGRGKTLKTIREFSVYFVIHSGDWYAALDTRPAPSSRNLEISDPGLPDREHIRWGSLPPVPGQGPFLASFWGGDWRKAGEDARRNLVEFTPGAMSNLLSFVRQASRDNIKGNPKPAAVVLDRRLLPYTYQASTGQIQWNEEGRERFRELLREGLPAFTDFYNDPFGYLWNPKPGERTHPDFTVEYLLDVRPMPPFIYFTGNDDFVLTEAEVDTLYQYVLRGGAIWGDSGFAGENSKFDAAFKRELKRVIPDKDKPFRPLRKEKDLFVDGPDAYFDASNGLPRLPFGLQYYDAPIEVIEMLPGLVSVVLTRNAYGNFLRFETAIVNNRFQIGGQVGRGSWAATMWQFRNQFFRGLSEESVLNAYKLGTNILVYMLGRWPAVLNRPENRALLE